MSHVDTWDPKSGAVMGPTKTIKSSADGVLLGEYLPRTAKQMHHGTVVRSLTSTQGAHEQGNYFMHTSYQLRGTINHPSLGAWLQHFRGVGNPTLPGSVYVGNASRHPGAGFFFAGTRAALREQPGERAEGHRTAKGPDEGCSLRTHEARGRAGRGVRAHVWQAAERRRPHGRLRRRVSHDGERGHCGL